MARLHMLPLVASVLAVAAASSGDGAAGTEGFFAWHEIEPTSDLRYHPCYDGFKCARLKVPMDWLDPHNSVKGSVALAITVLPAVVPEDDERFAGTIVTNPGGPGGSGVSFVQRQGRQLRAVVDTPGRRHHEILSFDPRGVNFTTPRSDCFRGDAFARDALALERRGAGGLDAGRDAIGRLYALTGAFGALCADGAGADNLAYVSTPSVARDMVEIIDRVDELRRKTLRERARQRTQSAPGIPESPQRPIVSDGAGEEVEEETKDVVRIQYLGFSYGSILGNTFASMFPGRVGRLIIDGIADANDYMKGGWLTNLQDTDKIVDYFYDGCFAAGDRCPLNRPGDKSSADLKKRVDALIAAADAAPIPFLLAREDGGREVAAVTGNDVRYAFQKPVYSPLALFEPLARTLADALEGNFTLLMRQLKIPQIRDACALGDTRDGDGKMRKNGSATAPLAYYMSAADEQAAIACGDSDAPHEGPNRADLAHYIEYVDTLKGQSAVFGPSWAEIMFLCSGWRVRPKWQFKGPFTTPPASVTEAGLPKEGVPAAPLLFLSTTLDPVTPLVNAFRMSAGHPGSAVVVQEGAGHCAIGSGFSECTNEIVRAYLEHGVVPETGTKCGNDCLPWQEGGCPQLERGLAWSPPPPSGNWLYSARGL